MPPPPKPKAPPAGAPLLGEDGDAPTHLQPRQLQVPRTIERTSSRDGFETTSDIPTNPGRRRNTGTSLPSLTGESLPAVTPPAFTGVAPEVSKGRFYERANAPRGVLPHAALLNGLETALQKAAQPHVPVRPARAQLKAEWLPLLRQVVEQAGGDGLDAYVTQLLDPPGQHPVTPLVPELTVGMERLEAATSPEALLTAARQIHALVSKALEDPSPQRASLKLLEAELDGRVDVDTLLSIRFASNAELETRRAQAEKTIESLRLQMRSLPGKQPDGLFSNLARMKVEKRVMEAELRRRGGQR